MTYYSLNFSSRYCFSLYMYTCHVVRVRYKKSEYVPIQYAGAFNKYLSRCATVMYQSLAMTTEISNIGGRIN